MTMNGGDVASRAATASRAAPPSAPRIAVDGGPITLRFQIVEPELRDLYRLAMERASRRERWTYPVIIGFALLALYFAWTRWPDVSGVVPLGLFLLILGLVTFVRSTWPRRQARIVFARDADAEIWSEHRYEFSERGIRIDSALSEQFLRWPAVRDVQIASSTVLLFLNTQMAYIIPKRVFGDEPTVQAFVGQIAAWRSAATNATDAASPDPSADRSITMQS